MEKPILIVDDSPSDSELILAALDCHKLAHRAIVLRDGDEALDYLYCKNSHKDRPRTMPAAILLDIKMPGLNGLEVLKRIKGDAALADIPVIMLTASEDDSNIKESYSLGANAYVTKPSNFSDFIQTVKDLGKFWAVINETPSDENSPATD